jgi:hypothetical protein
MRVKIKKAMTPYAKELILKKLEKLAPDNQPLQIEILQQSIQSCWQDVFPLKQNNQPIAPEEKQPYIPGGGMYKNLNDIKHD